jgi:exonuclease SbcC
MQLHRLKLLNFRQHADTEIVFGPGITAIIGPNGSGKTTLLEAIAWAFYGNPAARGSRDTIRWNRAPARSSVRVEVVFSLGAHEFRVVRGLYNAELFQDRSSDPIANSQQMVSTRVERLLGMTRDEFFSTYFTGQKELAVMAALGPTDRARFLSRVLGYERLRLAQEKLRQSRSAQSGSVRITPPSAPLAMHSRTSLVAPGGPRVSTVTSPPAASFVRIACSTAISS